MLMLMLMHFFFIIFQLILEILENKFLKIQKKKIFRELFFFSGNSCPKKLCCFIFLGAFILLVGAIQCTANKFIVLLLSGRQ